jgi:mxaJ protein
MSSRCHRAAAAALLAAALVPATPARGAAAAAPRVLRVCADPNNLPFSDARLGGFENRIAQVVADDLGATVEYTFRAQRRGFVRETLDARACDLIPGVPATFERALTTRPYYRSTYVFVSRADRGLALGSLDDPILGRLRIGVQLVGDDYANTPPAHALARRGLVDNVVGYTVYGDYAEPHPPARVVTAVASGEVDAAIVWGPLGGYFATRHTAPLVVAPLTAAVDPATGLPMTFAIAMGVRRDDVALRDAVQGALDRRRVEIERILDEYGVPR